MTDFVTSEMVQTALEYLGLDPHPIAVAKGDLVRAENARKAIRAKIFLETNGTAGERQAYAESSERYMGQCHLEADATERVEAARARLSWASAVIEVWRTQNANQRASERVR